MIDWLSKNFWLKIIALILAMITWFYVDEAIKHNPGEERLPFWVGYAHGNMMKRVRIKPAISGHPAEGYVIRWDKITVKPTYTFIIGPKRGVEKVLFLKTVEIDVAGQNKTYAVTIPLESLESESIRFYGAGGTVDVIIPIEKAQVVCPD